VRARALACTTLGALILGALGAACAAAAARAAGASFTPVTAGRELVFPVDFGSHPDFRTEWWYVTGWLTTRSGESLGFQITFFRSRPDLESDNPSVFTPRQIIIVHCALSDPKRGKLWQEQRVRRAGLGLAAAQTGDTDLWADSWSLKRDAAAPGAPYVAAIRGEELSFELQFTPTQAPMLNGARGFSRKGPAARAASYYYSIPHLRVTGGVARGSSGTAAVSGDAWLDHEWSSEYLDPQAIGWDWTGINLDDGGALMAFRIRGTDAAVRWAGGTLRSADGRVEPLDSAEVAFTPRRSWVSPRTGTAYPVEMSVRAGSRAFLLQPLMDDQENDTRFSTGAIYWEGAVRAYERGHAAGRGYLELTGYGERLRLR
jgi:predicted secreted hydrolase